MRKITYWLFSTVMRIGLLIVVANSIATAQPLTGTIFTTNVDSIFVNANIYHLAEDVYLNGGPRPNAPCTAGGLPDGDYYFQVTDPSGRILLHEITDTVELRKVRVTDGVIDLYYGGPRLTGQGKCQNGIHITIQLFPFIKTANSGGEYKVWLTRVADYDRSMRRGAFGFLQTKSKTDNFKVVSVFDEPLYQCLIDPNFCTQ
jgi:hypothetical protein